MAEFAEFLAEKMHVELDTGDAESGAGKPDRETVDTVAEPRSEMEPEDAELLAMLTEIEQLPDEEVSRLLDDDGTSSHEPGP